MLLTALLVCLPLLILISLSIFGGGQVFMPIFQWLWNFLAQVFGANIDENAINNVFAISNTTPGVVSTKFAFFTGYLVASGQWWGYIAVFLTYVIFCLPAIIVMVIAMKYIKKFKTNTFIANMLIIMKPIVSGIIIALAIQLFISIYVPEIFFNSSSKGYAGWTSNNYFVGYKNILLKIYVPIGILGSYYLAKRRISLFWIILINIAISLILFAPYAG
ncbi:chromate transporter [Mycoplasma sp. 2704]|uniref:chromate transporter n=1 Tax=unclassified Mycoplasma TaxID=2683645 RepID=UPI002B1DC0CD|nr:MULTISPECIES: chromate transporter [unclassified Mycoplasma]MEA4134404.1 chromate transporter [Mycoplasma sp. 2704]MEA4333447.1 chromate transporter [Mycoplasma sp. 1232]